MDYHQISHYNVTQKGSGPSTGIILFDKKGGVVVARPVRFELTPKEGITEQFFINAKGLTRNFSSIFNNWGQAGVQALAAATPRDTGLTASSWKYEVRHSKGSWTLSFLNTNVVDHVPIAFILQYGHLNRDGTFHQGLDYINPALDPIFNGLQQDLDRELRKL